MRTDIAELLLGASALGLLILAGGAADASSVKVNFNALPDGTPFPAQTTFAATHGPIRDEFAGAGVHFQGGGGVLTGNFGVTLPDGPNFLAFNARSVAAFADGTVPFPPEKISFDQPADVVMVSVGSSEGGVATLTAYDASGNVLGTPQQVPLTQVASPLSVQSNSYNIASVQLALTGSRSMVADDLVFLIQDHTNVPPTTQCVLSGPTGANAWYVGEVTATLTATDPDDTVVATQCRLDGGSWEQYSGPVVVSGDGPHTLEYQSLDSNGLWEDIKSESFKIDSTKPAVQLQLSRHFLWPPHGEMVPVVVSGSASDSTPGSGLAGVTFEVQDKYGVCQPALTSFGQTILLKASRKGNDREGRWYKITATATDNAGLQSSVSQWVLVPHSMRHEREEPPHPAPPSTGHHAPVPPVRKGFHH
jgi:hypothetical protein